jgi:hypothetical protein
MEVDVIYSVNEGRVFRRWRGVFSVAFEAKVKASVIPSALAGCASNNDNDLLKPTSCLYLRYI